MEPLGKEKVKEDDEKLSNCRQRENCLTDGKCLTRSVVYKTEVTSTDDNATQTYIGVTANLFKTRYRNHLNSLRNEKYQHETFYYADAFRRLASSDQGIKVTLSYLFILICLYYIFAFLSTETKSRSIKT